MRHLLTDVTGNTHRAEFCIDKLYSPDSLRGRLGLLELRGFEMPPHPDMALVQALLVRALVARFAEERYSAPLVRWGTQLHERFLLPHFAMADIAEVVADLRAHGLDLDPAWFAPYLEFRFPRIGLTEVAGVELELRSAIEPWHVLGEDTTSGGDVPVRRLLDRAAAGQGLRVRTGPASAGLQRRRGAADHDRHAGQLRRGVRYKAWKPWSALHPTLEIDSPLHFDVIDRASRLSLGGATYHVVHPGGRSYDHPPVNAARGRGAARRPVRGHRPHHRGDRRRSAGRGTGLAGQHRRPTIR